MTQHKPPQAVSLFDLIARSWTLGAEVRQVLFNANGSAVAALLADRTLAFVPTEDSEPPDKRMRMELETGRTMIRAREKALPTPILAEGTIADQDAPMCRLGDQGFAFLHRTGSEIWKATARGLTLRQTAAEGPVTAFTTLPTQNQIVFALGERVTLVPADASDASHTAGLGHEVRRMAVSADGQMLACWGPGHLSILAADSLERLAQIECDGEVNTLSWSQDNRWLAAGCGNKCVLLVDVPAGQSDRIVDYPAPVSDVAISASAQALISSGAFRVVGWRLPDLPFGDHEGTPVESGKPGLTIVDHVAAHPKRDLCAVAYANGLVTICQIGRRDELMLREGGGKPVTSMAWSDDGAHLAIGQADGTVSIATFPKNMFK
ncbi:WD40 repeat domain-containing protein [Tropicimonas isoalkanivorans]|uniref:WD domain, G-beta repeat n=1 Tax=Tropicimonas isoalkanivorans TaxID=441112 RepID=A0A1I1QDX4_9RHOB|nr:hypothetical protein [Tropicimonas isoalkanivorans]SFD20279.1 WD domain, G-beta repeat [Tropicimonas isoalkanivorans]